MPQLPFVLHTTFSSYTLNEILGQGGSGCVYGGKSQNGDEVAIKMLVGDKLPKDKQKRFQNELSFLERTTHSNIVRALDRGVMAEGQKLAPFYVMPKYSSSLRGMKIEHEDVLSFFDQLLKGVEAAQLMGVIHRDLKPENILFQAKSGQFAIADFGVASFEEEDMQTQVETGPNQRLANFLYSAPEQRAKGGNVGCTADIYALGLMLNETFTGSVPQGTNFARIGDINPEFAYLDELVGDMINNAADKRPQDINSGRAQLARLSGIYLDQQKLSNIDRTVIPATSLDEDLVLNPPKLVDFDWDKGNLTLVLDKTVTPEWLNALFNMGGFSNLLGYPPNRFSFQGNKASIQVQQGTVQALIDHFRPWLTIASRALGERKQQELDRQNHRIREQLEAERKNLEARKQLRESIRL